MIEAKKTDTGDITILIKTFERPRNLRRLLRSIFFYYSDVKVIIADDSRDPERNKRSVMERWPDKNIEYLLLPYDVGPSEGRNRAWQRVTTRYFVLCDDDFIFDHRTDLTLMRQQLEEHSMDLVAGMYFESRKNPKRKNILYTLYENILGWLYDAGLHFSLPYRCVFWGELRYDSTFKKLQVIGCDLARSDKIFETDLAPQFFIAKTSIRDRVLWRPELKLTEHVIFFWDLKKKGFKVLLNTEVGVNHIRAMPLNYRIHRYNKLNDNRLLEMKTMGIEVFERGKLRRTYKDGLHEMERVGGYGKLEGLYFKGKRVVNEKIRKLGL